MSIFRCVITYIHCYDFIQLYMYTCIMLLCVYFAIHLSKLQKCHNKVELSSWDELLGTNARSRVYLYVYTMQLETMYVMEILQAVFGGLAAVGCVYSSVICCRSACSRSCCYQDASQAHAVRNTVIT